MTNLDVSLSHQENFLNQRFNGQSSRPIRVKHLLLDLLIWLLLELLLGFLGIDDLADYSSYLEQNSHAVELQ